MLQRTPREARLQAARGAATLDHSNGRNKICFSSGHKLNSLLGQGKVQRFRVFGAINYVGSAGKVGRRPLLVPPTVTIRRRALTGRPAFAVE
ncbi:hypothetical protein E2C01_090046 [Portunus trituberculatus]|uniref:Uncharacterized protein n=1 Tax=Portunus trituberculatus TaxID=210409 RepID=A0A5B7JP21_PORTR|nr:hypothetical protein [Portunus trituberculatus]